MKTNRRFKNALALFMSVLMLFSVFAPAVSAISVNGSLLAPDTHLTSKTDYIVAPGITETHITLNNSTGSNQVMAYAIEVDLSNTTTSVIASYKDYDGTKWGMQSVRDQAAAAERKLGVNVVAGVNADFYNMQTGAPRGPLVMNNIVYSTSCPQTYFGITKDGKAVIGSGAPDYSTLKECIGGGDILLKDGQVTAVALANPDSLPRCAVGITATGSVMVYVADGRQAPTSCGQTYAQIAYTMLSMGCVDVINLDGGGSATMISQHEGSDELICRNSPSDGTERTVSTALLICSSAKPTGVFDHASLTPNNEVYTPGSEVQFTAVGVDSAGAAVALPEDGTFALADSSFGTITNDGLFVSNGKTGVVTVNYISGGEVCGEVSIEIQIPDTFFVPNSEVSLGFEETTDFGIVARYQERPVNMKSGDIKWSVNEIATRVEPDEELGEVTVEVPGEELSAEDIAAIGTFDGLTFTTKDGVTKNVFVTATLSFNAEVTATIKVIIGAMPVVLYDFEYTTDPAEAEANPDLKWIPSYEMPTFDRTREANEGLKNADQAKLFYEAGYPLYNWPNGSLTDQNSMKSRIVSKADGEPVRFGDHSYRIDYDYSSYNGSSNSNNYVRVTNAYKFEGSPTAIGCWVYVPEGTANFHLYLNCSNKSDGLAYALLTGKKGIDWTGWKYVEFDLTDPSNSGAGPANAPFGFYQGCGVFWISYQANGTDPRGDRTASTIYLDNIQLVYGANTDDTDNPIISSVRTDDGEIADGKTVLTSNTNTFKASYADFDGKYAMGIDFDEVKMLIDGVDVTDKCFINEGDEEIYFYDAVLANGTHSVEISVSDKFGNTTTDTRYFTVAGDMQTTEVSLVAADETPILGSDYTLNIVANNPADVLSADVDVKILSYFTTYWDKFTVVPSANYELAGEAKYDATNTTISFTLNRKADADASADDGTLASIVFAIPTNVPEGLEVTYRIAKGALTYASDRDAKFASSFSGKITTSCSSPFIINVDTMVVGSDGGYIHVTDMNGKPVEGVNIYTGEDVLIGTTDADGKVFTDMYVGSVMQFSIYAEKDGRLSFVYNGQSFPAGGDETGAPVYVKLNASSDPATSQSISWMASPLAAKGNAVVLYAEKSAYEADGEKALKTFNGVSEIVELSSSATFTTNYAVRINSALITGLEPNTDYVYKAGDGEIMSELKSFSTAKAAKTTNFFIIGDTQATNTTNTDEITKILSGSSANYAFGIQTGDAVDNGGNYTMWSNIAKVLSGDFLGAQDMIHVLGNHEYYGDLDGSTAASYFNLPGTKNNGEAPLYYSIQYGNVYIAVINYSNNAGYREAAEWLVKDAAASNATWKILTMHQPAYYTNPSGNNSEMQEIISNAVDEAGIDFVFSGHDHSYARTEPLTNGEVDTENGAVYYICGSTGEKSYEIVDNEAHHFATLVSDYNAVYLTVSVTDTEFTVTTYDCKVETVESDETDPDNTEKKVVSTPVVIDSFTMKKEVTCTDDGHDFMYDDGILTCPVCSYCITTEGYTGFATDAVTGGKKYFIGGNMLTESWYSFGNDHYYFDKNGDAVTGEVKIGKYTYTFGEDGKLVKGALVKEGGAYYYYIAGEKQRGWHMIDGYWYYFDRETGYKMSTGRYTVESTSTDSMLVYTFSSDGKLIKGAWEETPYGTRYFWGPSPVTGWQYIDEAIYYFNSDAYMVTGENEIDEVTYTFGEDGKLILISDAIEIDGIYYSYDASGNLILNHIKDHPYEKVVDEAVAPTKEATGLTEGEHCGTCGDVIVEQKVLPKVGETTTEPDDPTGPSKPDKPTDPKDPDGPKIPVAPGDIYLLGDVDNNGKVEAADARLALRIAAKIDPTPVPDSRTFIVTDVDMNAQITAADARKILRVSAQIDKF